MMSPDSRYRSVRRRLIARELVAPGLLLLAMLAAASIVAIVVSAGNGTKEGARADVTSPGGRLEQASLKGAGGARPVFRHSVIPGGVFTPQELQNALTQDAVAAAHYQGLDAGRLRTETVQQARYAYVSYRKDDQIYWTRNKVRISEGETILTDGTTEVRARCGNCISEEPRFPVADAEPDVAELDRLVDDPFDQQNASLSALVREALESSLSALGRAVSPGSSGTGTPNNASGTGALASAGSGVGTPGAGGARARSAQSTDPVSSAPAYAGAGPGQPEVAAGLANPAAPATASDGPAQAAKANSSDPGGRGENQRPDSVIAGPPNVPSLFPTSGPSSPSADPFKDTLLVPPVAGGNIPPGIDLPPGLDPSDTARNPAPQGALASTDPQGQQAQRTRQVEVASIPEPGSLFLFGAGAVATLWRNVRTRRSR